MTSPTHNTIIYLQRCRAARAAGYGVSYTTDPRWLVNMAINRRAGWPDDPGFTRGSAMPVNGAYPKRASDQAWRDLRHFAQCVNSRCVLRANEMRHLPKRIVARLQHRIGE